MGVLDGLKPERVFHFFEELEQIPRGSGNTGAVSEWLCAFAQERSLRNVSDDAGNVVIYADGTEGHEDSETLILQGHMDMVCQKRPSSEHDFTKDPVELVVDGDLVRARDTTLGGDDGIAIAYMLAILDDPSIPHPPLECVFTNDEEVGLLGANAFDCSRLSGRRMINLDSEDEGIFTCGCAGGVRIDTVLPIRRMRMKGMPVLVEISGLLGGHSGQMIDQYRANADKLMGRFLFSLGKRMSYSLESVAGGDKDNAIPSVCKAHIVVDPEDYPIVVTYSEEFEKELRNEYSGIDEGIHLHVEKGNVHKMEVMDLDSQDRVILMMLMTPYGVRKMSGEIEGLVETSANLGIVRSGKEEFACTSSVRSSKLSARKMMEDEIRALSEHLGGSIRLVGAYPAWEFREDSPLRDTMMDVYNEMYGEDPVVNVIHAGLECGLFYQRIADLDAVSIGPDMNDIHTYNESLSISSVERVWNYLLNVLSRL